MTSVEGGYSADRWKTLKALLAECLAIPADEQEAFVCEACEEDVELANQLRALVFANRQASPLDTASIEGSRPSNADFEPAWVGRRLGHYHLVRLIARGGMGEVYEAERDDGQFERRVAIKVMRLGLDEPEFIERFSEERRILGKLDHPNLAKLIDSGLDEAGAPYFVMDLVEGVPIDMYCEQHHLSVRDRIALVRIVCEVVAYAHRQGVVHRDLKPQNILVTHEGDVKLVDFGIAKRLDIDQDRTLTAFRALTPEYASPEQLLGKQVGPSSDIYSLGVVLYRLLAGIGPYATAVQADHLLATAICNIEPTRPSQVARGWPGEPDRRIRRALSGDLDAVVLMALRKEPERRFPSARALQDDLFRYLEGMPVLARRGALSYRASRFLFRHRVAVAAFVLANAAISLGAGAALWQSAEARHQRDRAEQNAADMRQLASVLIFDVHEKLVNVAGTTDARKLLVDNALIYLQKVESQAQNDPKLMLAIVSGHLKCGDALGRAFFPNLGDTGGAEKEYLRGISVAQSLTAQPGFALEARRDLSMLHNRMAALDYAKSDFLEANGQAKLAVEFAMSAQSGDRAGLQLLAYAYAQRAKVLTALGGLNEVLAVGAKSIVLYQKALQRSGDDDTDLKIAMASTLTMMAWTSERLGRLQQAVDFDNEAILAAHSLLQRTPDSTRLLGLLASALAYKAHALLGLQRSSEAVEPGEQAVQIWQSLVDKDAQDIASKQHLLGSLAIAGKAMVNSGRVPTAVAKLEQAIRIYKSLPQDAQVQTFVQQDLQDVNFSLAACYEKQAVIKDGFREPRLQQALALLRKVRESHRHTSVVSKELGGELSSAQIDEAIGRIQARLGRSGAA